MSRTTEKVGIYLAIEGSVLAFISTNPRHIFGSIVGSDFGLTLTEKRPHKPKIAYDIVRIQSFMIYTGLIECNIASDTTTPLLRCFPSNSKLKAADILTTVQSMNYQTFSNLQFKPVLKNSFHCVHID